MVLNLQKENVSNADLNKRIYIINRYPPPTSIYRYTNDLLSVFANSPTLVNLNFDPKEVKFNNGDLNFSGKFLKFPSLNHVLRNISFRNFRKYIQTTTLYKGKVILHYTNQFSGTVHISNVVEVVSIHDSPFYVENLSIFEKIYMRTLYISLRDKPYIVTNTEHLKNELMRFGFKGEISNIYLPYSPTFRKLPINKKEIRKALGLPLDKKLILSVSNNLPRKNLLMVKNVVEELGSDFKLIRVGSPLGKSITFKDIDDETLNKLYNATDVLLFPSLYEGFGLPIIEAFAAGLPVVSSEIPTIREIAGDFAVLSDPNNVDALKRSVNFALDNSDRLSRNGIERAKNFSTTNFNDAILKLYKYIEENIS